MKKIGTKLKQTREKKGFSISKVYEDTKIHPKILKALEDDIKEDLPESIYVKSFIEKYATYLGLDAKSLLKQFSKSRKDTGSFTYDLKQKSHFKKDYIKVLTYAKNILYVVLVLSFIFLGYRGIRRIFLNRSIRTERAVSVSESDAEIDRAVEKRVLVPKGERLVLTIETFQDTWMQVRSDGNIIFQRILEKGRRQEFKADDNFELWVGKGDGVKLYLNNVPLKPLGSGVIRNILIDRSGLTLPTD